jgi:hypothetical protein
MNFYHPPQRNWQGQDPGVRGRHLSLLGECLACFVLAVVNTLKPIAKEDLRSSRVWERKDVVIQAC